MSKSNARSRNGLWHRSTALDRLTIGYILAFAVALFFLGRDNAAWGGLLLVHLALAAAIIVVIHLWHNRSTGVAGFIRQLYPAMLYPLFYSELAVANFWIFPEFLDARLVAFERAIFGLDPNIWITSLQSPWLNEVMMLGYFSYYPLIPIVALPLFFRRRIDDLRGLLLGATTAFVISYIGFVVYPVEGPRYFLADRFDAPLAGWLFVPLVRMIIDGGAIHGGCMPSSHVAVALVALVWALRTMPRLGRVLVPFVILLAIGTAWGRFHYVTDAVVGVAVGLAALALTGFWRRKSAVEHELLVSSARAMAPSGTLQ